MPLPLPLVGQKADEWIQCKAFTAIGWGFCGFCKVKMAIFRILRLFLGMMPLGKKYLFLALNAKLCLSTVSDQANSAFCEFVDPQTGEGVLGPHQTPAHGSLGGGCIHTLCQTHTHTHTYIYLYLSIYLSIYIYIYICSNLHPSLILYVAPL